MGHAITNFSLQSTHGPYTRVFERLSRVRAFCRAVSCVHTTTSARPTTRSARSRVARTHRPRAPRHNKKTRLRKKNRIIYVHRYSGRYTRCRTSSLNKWQCLRTRRGLHRSGGHHPTPSRPGPDVFCVMVCSCAASCARRLPPSCQEAGTGAGMGVHIVCCTARLAQARRTSAAGPAAPGPRWRSRWRQGVRQGVRQGASAARAVSRVARTSGWGRSASACAPSSGGSPGAPLSPSTRRPDSMRRSARA